MTLAEFAQWYEVEAAKAKEGNEFMNTLPEGPEGRAIMQKRIESGNLVLQVRAPFSDLPPELQEAALKSTDPKKIKEYLSKSIPVFPDLYKELRSTLENDALMMEKVKAAIRAAKWVITKEENGELWGPTLITLSVAGAVQAGESSAFVPVLTTLDIQDAFGQVCREKDQGKPEKLTEIKRAEFFGLPVSKAWQQERAIAAEGAAGMELNVGKKTAAGFAIVDASITDREGKPLEITELQKGVQRAIGNLIYEAGGKAALPITVSPAQIYRAYARLTSDAMVTEAQEKEMEAAMDVLMYAPSSLNFTAQLEKHKHIKQQADYDYTGKAAGKLEGTLIQAQKQEATSQNGSRVVAYKVYDVPVFYMYSHAVNQMAWVPNYLLTGSMKPATKPATAEAQEGANYVAVKENILTRVLRMVGGKNKVDKTIRAAEVAEDCGIVFTSRKVERTLLKNIGLYLDDLKTQGKIKGYTEAKEGRKITGYTINI